MLLEYLEKVCQDKGGNGQYFKLKSWDQLRDEIADYMKIIELEDENSEAAVEKVVEIAGKWLNSEIPAFIKAFNKVKVEDCSIA